MEWISCKDELPPKRVWVEVCINGEIYLAKRVGLLRIGKWKHKSGLVDHYISGHHVWRHKLINDIFG